MTFPSPRQRRSNLCPTLKGPGVHRAATNTTFRPIPSPCGASKSPRAERGGPVRVSRLHPAEWSGETPSLLRVLARVIPCLRMSFGEFRRRMLLTAAVCWSGRAPVVAAQRVQKRREPGGVSFLIRDCFGWWSIASKGARAAPATRQRSVFGLQTCAKARSALEGVAQSQRNKLGHWVLRLDAWRGLKSWGDGPRVQGST